MSTSRMFADEYAEQIPEYFDPFNAKIHQKYVRTICRYSINQVSLYPLSLNQ